MDKHVRVTVVPKRLIRRSQSKIVPIIKNEWTYGNLNSRSIPSVNPSIISTQISQCKPRILSAQHMMTINTNNSKRSLLNSVCSFDTMGPTLKKSFPNQREQNINKKKTFPKRWLTLIIILVILFILAAVGVGIYLIIRFTTPTSATTHPPIFPLRWNSTGQTVAGIGAPGGTASNQLDSPLDLVIDSSNTLYIVDYNNNRIQKWLSGARNATTVAGQSSGSAGSNATHLRKPTGVDLDSNDNIYIADTSNFRVQFWAKDSFSGQTVAGTGIYGSSNDQFHSAYHVVYNENTKTLYAVDYDIHRIMSYTSGLLTGNLVAGGNGPGLNRTQLKQPTRFFFDSVTNSFLIANFGAHNIVRWVLGDSSWTLVAGGTNGSCGTSSTFLCGPIAVTIDPMGNVYVADAINARIQMFLVGQNIGTTICGITSSPGSNSSQLSSPYTVRLDNQLNLYVADAANYRIQKYLRY